MPTETPVLTQQVEPFTLTSDAFENGGLIPSKYTCDGEDLPPPLTWNNAPEGTHSFALIMDDPDAPGGVFTHWVLVDFPQRSDGFTPVTPQGRRIGFTTIQGRNDFTTGNLRYRGPCPPPGNTHRYHFTVYALDTPLAVDSGPTKEEVFEAMQGHILGEALLVGIYQR
jgi:hypothetical protein